MNTALSEALLVGVKFSCSITTNDELDVLVRFIYTYIHTQSRSLTAISQKTIDERESTLVDCYYQNRRLRKGFKNIVSDGHRYYKEVLIAGPDKVVGVVLLSPSDYIDRMIHSLRDQLKFTEAKGKD